MNVFFNAFNTDMLRSVAVKIIRSIEPENCYSLCDPRGAINSNDIPEQTKLTSFPFKDIYYCVYKDVEWPSLNPLPTNLLLEQAPFEAELMHMMDRDEAWYSDMSVFENPEDSPRFEETQFDIEEGKKILQFKVNKYVNEELSYQERKRIYLKHLRFWNDFLTKAPINLFISADIPHNTHEYVLFRLVQHFSIPILMIGHTPFLDTKLIFQDFIENEIEVLNEFERLKIQFKEKSEIPLSNRFEEEWKRVTTITSDQEKPYYVDVAKTLNNRLESKIRFSPSARIAKFFTYDVIHLPSIIRKRFDIDYWHWRIKGFNDKTKRDKKMFQFYKSKCEEPNMTKKYIYAPLHFMPENSSAPMGGIFANQLLMIEMIADSVPSDVLIYVKENPNQKSRSRTIHFYLDLLKIPNVRFVSRSYNSFKLLENCIATATLTGTAGWEGLFKGKPCLMFGNYVYQYAPGVFRISEVEDCRKAIQMIMKGQKPELNDLRLFVKAVENVSVHAWIDSVYEEPISDISREENIENLVNGFLKKIDALNIARYHS